LRQCDFALQNHRAVKGAGPYDPIIEQLAKPEFEEAVTNRAQSGCVTISTVYRAKMSAATRH
jgi:hypothetical protein